MPLIYWQIQYLLNTPLEFHVSQLTEALTWTYKVYVYVCVNIVFDKEKKRPGEFK